MSRAGGTRGWEGCGGAGAPSGPRARSASPMRIRICFFPKIREKSADTVRPMVGPGAGARAGTRGEGWNRPAAGGGWGATAEGGGAAAAASARPGPPDVTWPRPRVRLGPAPRRVCGRTEVQRGLASLPLARGTGKGIFLGLQWLQELALFFRHRLSFLRRL